MDQHERFKKLEEQAHDLYNKYAESISTLIRSCESKESRLTALRNTEPTTETLSKIYTTAMQQEDYETCEAIQEYADEKGIQISH